MLIPACNCRDLHMCETFPDPLGDWRTRWLAQNSNMTNYYVCTGNPDENNRGNNPCGLWICDTDQDFQTADIVFNPSFGSTVTQFSMGIMVFVPAIFTLFDVDGVPVYSTNLDPNGTFPPCSEDFLLLVNTPGGLGEFTIAPNGGGQIEGNTSVFDICVGTTEGPVPVEQTTWGRIKARYN
jgi:hypothetical protein